MTQRRDHHILELVAREEDPNRLRAHAQAALDYTGGGRRGVERAAQRAEVSPGRRVDPRSLRNRHASDAQSPVSAATGSAGRSCGQPASSTSWIGSSRRKYSMSVYLLSFGSENGASGVGAAAVSRSRASVGSSSSSRTTSSANARAAAPAATASAG